MALDITALDLIVDETTGLQDSDVDATNPPYSTNATVSYLLGLDAPGGLTAPQVAYRSSFAQASASAGETISAITLAKDANGTAFSTTVGTNSNIRTVDGKYVWLFQDSTHANVVIGVIGTSDANAAPAAPNLTDNQPDPLAFSFALVSTTSTNADLYVVQYVPLLNPVAGTTLAAFDDQIDLAGKVFASVTATTTVNFSQLSDAPSGHNNWYILDADAASPLKILVTAHDNDAQTEVNVSTQGLGVASQDVRFGRELQIDLITGGIQSAGKSFTNSPQAPTYTNHIETISTAGFTISQSTPTNSKADIELHAYNNDDDAKGSLLPGDDNDVERSIAEAGLVFKLNGVLTTMAALNITTTAAGAGIVLHNVGEGVSVEFTASGTFDRFVIKNVDGDKDYFDVKEVHFSTMSPNAYAEEIGSFINFDDDGPTLTIDTAVAVAAAEVVEASAAGGKSQAAITAPTFTAGGADGTTSSTSYALALIGTSASGLQTTVGNKAITLVVENSGALISGRYDDGIGALHGVAFTVDLATSGKVTLTSLVALEHPNGPQNTEVNTLSLTNLVKLVATVTTTDGDGDHVSQESLSTALSLTFDDTDPMLSITSPVAVGAASVTEVAGASTPATITAPVISASAVDGYSPTTTYALALATNSAASGLQTTAGNKPITLVVAADGQSVSGKYDSNSTLDATAFIVGLSGTSLTLTSLVALEHSNTQGGAEDNTLTLNGLINLVATVTATDGDNDAVSQQSTTASAISLTFVDTEPTIVKSFDADPATSGDQSPEHLGNASGQTAGGNFGYSMTDQVTNAEYTGGASDFANMVLTGYVNSDTNNLISNVTVTSTAETTTSASFDFLFHYDKDPITAGIQDATAGGTLLFDKAADTYAFTLTDPVDGYSFNLIQTSALVAKMPTSNTGHPPIVIEQLTQNSDAHPFFVQFTANSVTNQVGFGFNSTGDSDQSTPSDKDFTGTAHDLVTNKNEDWVSATQSTNGVAGDTIQKGELLTLRFFNTNILSDVTSGTERIDPTAKASEVVVKFDGIGNSEDLLVILDLKAADGTEITRAINVENGDLIRGNANVPSAYSGKFTLDQNDALLIIQQNDYAAAGETYQIQGMQIMQSGNGLGGLAIDLDGGIGANHGSSTTTGLQAWDPTDNDVLKIVDIGFVQTTSGTIDANLDFAFNIIDGDGDQSALQHINVMISDSFII